MLTRKLTHLEAHAIAHRLRQAGEVVAGVVEELEKLPVSQEYPELSADARLLVEAWDFGQFSPDFDQPLAKPVRAALGRICSQLALAASAPTLGKSEWPSDRDAAIQACALMVLGICKTEPQEVWPKRIEGRIRYLLSKLQPKAAEPNGAPAAWINYPCKIENNEFAGHGEPELTFKRQAYGYDLAKAEPLYRAVEPKGLTEEQREALKYAVYALKHLTSVQADDALEVIGALLKNGE